MDLKYLLNDPTTPDLVVSVELPPAPAVLNFKIEGYAGVTDSMYTVEHQAAMCHYSLVTAIHLMNKVLKTPITHWSSVQRLSVQPRAGRQLNAFYDRKGLRYFYAMNPITKKMVYAVNSADVRLHELGHALLDALRPDLFNVQAFEIWGFHESFGDIHAIINFLNNDFALDYVLRQTDGYLYQDNCMSRLAEEMGNAVFDMTGGKNGNVSGYLRNAFNEFLYVVPNKLPRSGKDNVLTSEPHSFSRVFTGAWYELLCRMHEANKSEGMDTRTALVNARDVLTSYTYNAIPNAPATIRFYDGFAKAMLVQDKLNGYKFNQLMNNIFIGRKILSEPVKPMVNLTLDMMKMMSEPADEILEHPNVSVVRTKNISSLTLPDFMVNVEAPNDTYYEFDADGNCVDNIDVSPVELIDHARECVAFLQEKGMIRSDSSTPFEITNDGNLIRSHFSGCFLNNCTNPTQPEFLKCWKPENNSGCGCGSKKKSVCSKKAPVIITSANTRLSVTGCGNNTINSSGDTVRFGFGNIAKITPKC
jgi:hypothetical protein